MKGMKLNAHPLIELMRLDGGRGLSAKEENQKRNATGLLCQKKLNKISKNQVNSTGENIQTISRQVKDAQVQEGKRWVGGKKGGCGWRVNDLHKRKSTERWRETGVYRANKVSKKG